jgi:hypothetical protein
MPSFLGSGGGGGGFPDARSSPAARSVGSLPTTQSGHQLFGGTWPYGHPNRFDPEHRGSVFLRSIEIHIHGYPVSQCTYHNLYELTSSGCQNIFFEVRHPRCVGSKTRNFCVLHVQSNTTMFHLVVQ